jgi:hypothetical protein
MLRSFLHLTAGNSPATLLSPTHAFGRGFIAELPAHKPKAA